MEPVPITKVLIASSLCTGNVCPVNLVNDSNQYVKLRTDTVLGQTEAVSGLMEDSTEVLGFLKTKWCSSHLLLHRCGILRIDLVLYRG
jgi:hypothetical protein